MEQSIGGVKKEQVEDLVLESVERWVYWSKAGSAVPPQSHSVLEMLHQKLLNDEELDAQEKYALKARLTMELRTALREGMEDLDLGTDVCELAHTNYTYVAAIEHYCI